MADITMCTGQNCGRKELCYRHTAVASEFQYYFYPLQPNGDCAEYWYNNEWNEKRVDIIEDKKLDILITNNYE